ncbi:MAG: hypothetical protein ABI881_17320 [Betaproteobacteria bacterium]
MNTNKLMVGALAASMASSAFAGFVTPLGQTLGVTLGRLLGAPLGTLLPVAGGGLLLVAAASLAIGIAIVRRKQKR